jgi:hypothetical protein
MLLTWIITGAIAVPFIVMAVFLLYGKGAFLIAGYNTMSEEKRATYDEKALCRSVGRFLLILTAAMLLFPLAIQYDAMWLFYVVLIVILVLPIGFVIYMNTGNRHRISIDPDSPLAKEERKPMSRGKKAAVFAGILISVWICVAIGVMFIQGERDPTITVQNNMLKISAMYGLDVELANITEITLIDRSMSDIGVGSRTNGYGGRAQKGHFNSGELGLHMLFVNPGSSPTIRIERIRGGDIYISYRSGETTKAVYRDLAAMLPAR